MHKIFMRRVIFLLLAVLMISCGSLVYAESNDITIIDSGTWGDNITWKLDSSGVLTFSGNGEMCGEVNEFGEFPPRPWSSAKVKSVIIEDGITNIVGYAFADCNNLKSITIPNSINRIGKCAFLRCTTLTSITIPENVTSIGDGAFYECRSLTSIIIPNNVTSIEHSTFYSCESLKSVTIPHGVTSIGTEAFENCKNLKSIVIPDSVKTIGGYAFDDCSSLESITIPDSVISIGKYAFYFCWGLESVTISDSLTYIDSAVFFGCTNLKSIIIPNSVESIGENAFGSCSSLESITIPDSVISIMYNSFYNCENLVIFGNVNSYAHEYAEHWDIKFQCLTHTYGNDYICDDCGFENEALKPAPAPTPEPEVTPTPAPTPTPGTGESAGSTTPSNPESGGSSGTPAPAPTPKPETPKHVHTIVADVAVDPTCTATGLTAGEHCTTCNDYKVAQNVVPALGHVAAEKVTKATAAKAGQKVTSCTTCGEVLNTVTIKPAKVTLSKAGVNYTGKKVKAPTIVVKDGNGKKIDAKYYTVTKPKNVKKMKAIGRYTYIVKFKANCPEYKGTVKLHFEIKPAKTAIKAPAAAKKAITVKWQKGKKAQVIGYDILLATDKKFSKNKKTVTVKGVNVTSKKVNKLKAKTKYFVKVRTYKTVKGVKIYSDWSKVKTIRTK